MKKKYLPVLLFCIFVCNIHAKRLPPPDVVPLSNGNFIYKESYTSSKDNAYDFGVVIIESVGDVKYRFLIPIYSVNIDRNLEYDVQWKFIKSMEFKNDDVITIINERNEVFELNINTFEVKCISGKDYSDVNELFERDLKSIIENHKNHKYTGSQPDKKKLAKIEDVIAVAEPALFSIYGDETVKKEMPYVIQKYKDKWFVHGYIPKNSLGGVFEIFIDAETSQIESVIHGE